jgi:hypothetical protein
MNRKEFCAQRQKRQKEAKIGQLVSNRSSNYPIINEKSRKIDEKKHKVSFFRVISCRTRREKKFFWRKARWQIRKCRNKHERAPARNWTSALSTQRSKGSPRKRRR